LVERSDKPTGYDIDRLERSIEATRQEFKREIARLNYTFAEKYHDHDPKYARSYHDHDLHAKRYHRHSFWELESVDSMSLWALMVFLLAWLPLLVALAAAAE
jgi:hypothetical protein